MSRYIGRYLDAWGLLAQAPPRRDGGDSCQRTGMHAFGTYLTSEPSTHWYLSNRFEEQLKKLDKPYWKYCRHPDKSMWYSASNILSRDQFTPLLIAMGAHKMYKRLFKSLFVWLLHGTFMYNTRRNGVWKDLKEHKAKAPTWKEWDYSWKLPDLAIVFLPLYIRAFRCWPLYPILILFDLELVISSLVAIFSPQKSGDDLNFICRILQAKHFLPTPISFVARWLYQFRPHMATIGKRPMAPDYITDSGPQSALQYYFRLENNDPPLDLLFKDIVEKM